VSETDKVARDVVKVDFARRYSKEGSIIDNAFSIGSTPRVKQFKENELKFTAVKGASVAIDKLEEVAKAKGSQLPTVRGRREVQRNKFFSPYSCNPNFLSHFPFPACHPLQL
jgi:hypothetical protein